MANQDIRILDEVVARQIAAGEVIDRPAAILRELIDNCIDAETKQIEVLTKDAGLDLIQVSDDGIGMSKNNLALCCLPHATSKISKNEDLLRILTMGFRGEALPSIAAVCRVTVSSKHITDSQAWQIMANNIHISEAKKISRNVGTTVKAERLFQDFPARRKFLSTNQTETNLLRYMMLKKAAAFPGISFTLSTDNSPTLKIPQESALVRSIRICSKDSTPHDFIWVEDNTDTSDENNIVLQAALGMPHIAQSTRRNIHIYINNRPIKEFAILQAIEYGYRNVMHGAKHPQVVAFLSIPPNQLDVNIHPAKTEIKIKGIEPIRRLIISTIEKQFNQYAISTPTLTQTQLLPQIQKPVQNQVQTQIIHKDAPTLKNSYESLFPTSVLSETPSFTQSIQPSYKPREKNKHYPDTKTTDTNTKTTDTKQTFNTQSISNEWKYLTTIFNTYLIFESINQDKPQLLLLDFHAAHERILYDELLKEATPMPLLVPIPLAIDTDISNLQEIITQYSKIGIKIELQNKNNVLSAVPSNSLLDADIIAKLLESLPLAEKAHVELFARRACRSASKAGDHIDTQSSYELLSQVLTLEHPRCPHGRPLWITLEKHILDTMIGRS